MQNELLNDIICIKLKTYMILNRFDFYVRNTALKEPELSFMTTLNQMTEITGAKDSSCTPDHLVEH